MACTSCGKKAKKYFVPVTKAVNTSSSRRVRSYIIRKASEPAPTEEITSTESSETEATNDTK